MTDQTDIKWPTCDKDGCIGIRLPTTSWCLAHAAEQEPDAFDAELKRMGARGTVDVRGVPITQALLEQILAAAPHDAEDYPTFMATRFDRATFQGDARFSGVTFQGDAEFGSATFQGGVWFLGVTFQGDARFSGATFQRLASFIKATFQGDAEFDQTTFQGVAGFGLATFQRPASFLLATFRRDALFVGATFQGDAEFRAIFQGGAVFGEATFHGDALFAGATFHGDALFAGATFQGGAEFGTTTFRREAKFGRARFEQARQLGPLLVYGLLRLDGAHFAQLSHIEVSTRGLSCQRARFPAGVQFRLRGAQIVLDDADLSGSSILVGIDTLSDPQLVEAVQQLAPQAAVELSARPRLLSVQGANVAGLAVSNVDLAECRFAGAHNLDRLQLGTKVTFLQAPGGLPWDWRQVIAEERAWRARSKRQTPRWPAARSKRQTPRWTSPQSPPAWLHDPYATEWPEVLPPEQIAGVYRALRKGREDAKDEPDAADFYYGEMEMRRHAGRPIDTGTNNLTDEASRGQVERPADSSTDNLSREASRGQVEHAILTVYWLVSGYGLRAWRALAWLAALTAGFAVAFHLAGFTRPPQPVSYWTSLLYAFRATLSLTDSEVQLTAWGKLLQGLLRLTGPVLLGLTLLAIRARTKR